MSNSLANRQFLALIRGESPVRKPHNPFRVMTVVEDDDRYCLRCCGKRRFDVIYGQNPETIMMGSSLAFEKAAICRACGHVVAHPSLARVQWIGGCDG